jgi:hypothetical protein
MTEATGANYGQEMLPEELNSKDRARRRNTLMGPQSASVSGPVNHELGERLPGAALQGISFRIS